MPLECPLVPRISEPRERMREYGQADAAGVLGEPGHLVVAVVDRVQLVQRGVQQVAGGHLRVPGAGVEEGGGAGQVVQTAHQPVERGDLVHRGGRVVLGQTAGHPQHEVLRGLDDLTGDRVPQQVAAVQGAQAEVAEPVVAGRVDQRVQPGGVQRRRTRRCGPRSGPRGVRRRSRRRRTPRPGRPPRRGSRGPAAGRPAGEYCGSSAISPAAASVASARSSAVVGAARAAAQRGGGDPAGVGVRQVGGQVRQGAQQRGAGPVARRPRGARPAELRRGLLGRWSRWALPRSVGTRWPREGHGDACGHAASRPPAQPARPGLIGTRAWTCATGALAAGRRTRGRTGAHPHHRCGTVPDSHRVPLRRQHDEHTSRGG